MEEQVFLPPGMAYVMETDAKQALEHTGLKEDDQERILEAMDRNSLFCEKVNYYFLCDKILEIFKDLGFDKVLAVIFLTHLDFGHGLEGDVYKYAVLEVTDCADFLGQGNPLPTEKEFLQLMRFLCNPTVGQLEQIQSLLESFQARMPFL